MATDTSRQLALTASAAVLLCLAACQRQDAPTPGVAGGSAQTPAAASSAPVTVPAAPDAQVGRGKSPEQGPAVVEGASGAGGTASQPRPDADPQRLGPPAIPPADAPGTAVPVPPASAASR